MIVVIWHIQHQTKPSFLVLSQREKMEKFIMKAFILIVVLFTTELGVASAAWLQAHATFYGGPHASGTMGN